MTKKKQEEEFLKLRDKIKSYNENVDITVIDAAWEFAKLAHARQKRLSGEDFVTHPLEVAKILADYKLDTVSIVAAFLHDSIEDGGGIIGRYC